MVGHTGNISATIKAVSTVDYCVNRLVKEFTAIDGVNDPTYIGSDHTRELVPFLAYSPAMSGNGLIETSDSFAAIGATIAANFQLEMPKDTIGESVLPKLI